MRRITPDEVAAAYEETGLKPKPGKLLRKDEESACGIGVLLVAAGHDMRNTYPEHIVECLDLSGRKYLFGFEDGFDAPRSGVDLPWKDMDYRSGYEDGKAAAKRVGLP